MHNTTYSIAAELHTHAAYESAVAGFQQRKGKSEAAEEFARRACRSALDAAILSNQVTREGIVAGPRPAYPLSSDPMHSERLAKLAKLFCTDCKHRTTCKTLNADSPAPLLSFPNHELSSLAS
jgi:hypothetical protein